MKNIKFIVSLLFTIILVFLLNSKMGSVPALGKFFNPFGGWWQNAETSKDFKDITIDFPELKEEVKVVLDDRLVPHIFAKNNEDLFFMQGYITAKYRLWQMEIQTHNAAGRVSEIVGEKALENDRLQRRIGLNYGAENSIALIDKDPESKKIIAAYCNGVNAYIKNLSPKNYPIEYKLLGYAPEEWTPLKVALLLKNMANMLSVYEFDIENSNFLNQYSSEDFSYLFPEHDGFEDFIIPKGTSWNFKNDSIKKDYSKIPEKNLLHGSDEQPQVYNNIIEKPKDLNGSNNWAVSGSKTKSGKPLLANDPHLELKLPSIWYEMHLVSPTINAYGATLPGAPCVISGFNDNIAWGVTNGGRDVRDWFAIQFQDAKKQAYLVDGVFEKTKIKIEKYKLPNGKEFLDTVRYTRYGPVVFDESFAKIQAKKYLALKWTAHEGSNEFKTFYLLNQGKNYADYLAALNYFNCPTQNFVFAARSGDIAIKEQGKHPITNKFVADGSQSSSDWKQFIPAEHNPSVLNPERGFVSSANQFPVDETYPYPVSKVGIYEEFRAMRINQLLADTMKMDVESMKKLHNDNFNTYASLLLPSLLQNMAVEKMDAEEKEVIELLKKWNLYNNPEQKEPIYFEAWATELDDLLWDEMSMPEKPMRKPNHFRTANFLRNDSTSIFYDNLQTGEKENRNAIVQISFSKAMAKLKEKYKTLAAAKDWGTHKATYVHHLSPALDAFSAFNVYNGGNRGIVNATNSTHGPSWRMIVDFGEMKGYCVIPGGQSGNPGSKYYDNMIATWAKGDYYEANFSNDIATINKKKLFTISNKK